jgi:hypothetical protein
VNYEEWKNHLLGDPQEAGRRFGEGFVAYICYPHPAKHFVGKSPDYTKIRKTIWVPHVLKRDVEGKYFWARKV